MDAFPEGIGCDDVFDKTEVEMEEAENKLEHREPLINRIDSLRETGLKVCRMKKTSLRRHIKPSCNSLDQTFFSLEFPDTDVPEVQIPTKRGATLKQAALPYFVHHNLPDFFAHDFFLMGSKSPLPLHAQSDLLAGSKISAKRKDIHSAMEARDGERKKRSSTGTAEGLSRHKRDSNRLIHAESLQHLVFKDFEHPEMPSGSLPRMKQQSNTFSRLTRMLSPSKERLERLTDTLEAFNITGIPLTWSPAVNPNKFHVKLKWLYLESSWEDVVQNSHTLTEQDKVQQSVIWELLATEANYIRNLKAVVDTHIAALHHLQSSMERIMSDIDSQKLFGNFEEVYVANGLFWKNHFMKMLKSARQTRSPLKIEDLYDGFIRVARLFSPYITFCIDTNNCRQYFHEKKESSSFFAKFIRWADQKILSDFNKEGFKDHLSKPFQRITRYKLLLDRIKDQTADAAERVKLNDMAASVACFVQDVNDRVEATQKYESLVDLTRRLEYAIPPDSPGEEYSRAGDRYSTFNILQPMTHNNNFRELLFEGPLKFRDKETKWTDTQCFIFTDMLVLARAKRGTNDRCKVLRPPIKLDRIAIERQSESPLQFVFILFDEFGFFRSLQAVMGQPKKLQDMVNKIEEAKLALVLGAAGINRGKVSNTLLVETCPPTLVSMVSGFPIDSLSGSVHTLSITDQRRRFRDPKGSDLAASNSICSLDNEEVLEEKEEFVEAEDEEEEEAGEAGGEEDLSIMESCSLSPCGRHGSRFLRTASPVQRKQQQNLRQQNCSSPHEPSDSPPLDDIPCDMAFRNRRGSRGDRRYRTADSLMPPRSHSIHKRLSLNYRGGHAVADMPPNSPTVPGLPATSVESFQSSSGFSSAGSAQHLHSGSELSEPGGPEVCESCVGSPPCRERAKKMNPRHCMSLNDLSRLGLDPISDTNDNEEDSPEGNSSSTSVRSVRKQYVVVQTSDGEGTDV